jgi:hypothetical protein
VSRCGQHTHTHARTRTHTANWKERAR